ISCSRHVIVGTGGSPAIRAGVVPSATAQTVWQIANFAAPDNHFTARPHRCVIGSGSGNIKKTGSNPTVCIWLVSSARIKNVCEMVVVICSTPHNHFTPGPHGCVRNACAGYTCEAGGCPTITRGIVFPARVKNGVVDVSVGASTPNNH